MDNFGSNDYRVEIETGTYLAIYNKLENQFSKKTCLICESQSADFFAERNKCDLYRCQNCKLIFVFPLPRDCAGIYSESYFSGGSGMIGYADYEGDEEAMAETFKAYLEKIGKALPKKGSLWDVGAATGQFARLAEKNGWRATGIEISEYAAGIARKKGLKIFTGNFETYDALENQFDAVTFWDVLEHFAHPETALRQAKKILKPGGILAINTPDSESLLARIFGKRWHLLDPPNHLHIFGRKNINSFLEKHNFEVLYISRVGKKFSLRYIFKMLSGWQKLKIWRVAYKYSMKSRWGNWKIFLNTRDNMFIIAKKQS